MRVPNAYEEGCSHAPSHIPGRKPLQTSRPDRGTRASLVNRSGRRNSFGHLVDGLRLRLRRIADSLAYGTAATPWLAQSMRIGCAEAEHNTGRQEVRPRIAPRPP